MIHKDNKKILSFLAALFILILFFQTAQAQKYPLEIYSSRVDSAEPYQHEGKVEMYTRHASLLFPILPFNSFNLVVYFKENEKSFTYNDFQPQIQLQESLQPVDVADFPDKLVVSSRGIFVVINMDNHMIALRHDVETATDWEDISEEDQAFLNQIIYRNTLSDSDSWMLGLTHRGGISDDMYIPMIGYTYSSDSFYFHMVLPAYLVVQYRFNDSWYILWDESLELDNYRLTEKSPWNNSISKLMNLTSRLELGMRTSNGFEIGLSYGIISHRNWIITDDEQEELGSFSMDNAAAWSLNFQLLL